MPTDESGTSSGCPVLEGPANYQIWKLRVLAELRHAKVSGIVLGTDEKPSAEASSAVTHTDSWDARDEKAHSIICRHINDRLLLAHGALSTSKALFDKLVEVHEKSNVIATAYYAFEQMVITRWDGSTPIEDHISAIRTQDHKLTAMKLGLDPRITAFLLISSIPKTDTWGTFKAAFLNSLAKADKISLEAVENRITAEATRLRNESAVSSATSSESALKTSRTESRQKFKSLYCKRHGECGHTTDKCRELKAEKRSKKMKGKEKPRRRREKAHQAGEGSGVESDDSSASSSSEEDSAHHVSTHSVSKRLATRIYAYVTQSELDPKKHHILIDSGASSTIVPHRSWFVPDSYKPLTPPRPVHFGDDSTVEAVGIGNVLLRSHVGNKDYDILLRDVLFIPTFAVTLISVHKLAKHHLTTSFSDIGCQVL